MSKSKVILVGNMSIHMFDRDGATIRINPIPVQIVRSMDFESRISSVETAHMIGKALGQEIDVCREPVYPKKGDVFIVANHLNLSKHPPMYKMSLNDVHELRYMEDYSYKFFMVEVL